MDKQLSPLEMLIQGFKELEAKKPKPAITIDIVNNVPKPVDQDGVPLSSLDLLKEAYKPKQNK